MTTKQRTQRIEPTGRAAACASGVMLVLALAGCGVGGAPPTTTGRAATASAWAAPLLQHALTPAAAKNRPASVPDGFVVTPHGYFHPSCVVEMGAGERLRPEGTLARRDGSVRQFASCQYPHYDKQGNTILPEAAPVPPARGAAGARAATPPARATRAAAAVTPPPTYNDWLVRASFVGPALREIETEWRVPPAPTIQTNQTLYYFPGLQNSTNVKSILQPVLGWNAFNDNAWTIASWNCCVTGTVFHGDPVQVNTGDDLDGFMIGDNCTENPDVCPDWSINIGVGFDPVKVSELTTSSYGVPLDWIFGGVLEVYNVDNCGQLPASGGVGSITFHEINMIQVSGPPPMPNWVYTVGSSKVGNNTPNCGIGGTVSDASTLSLTWSTGGCDGQFKTHGLIADKYQSWGGCPGVLGLPTTDETGTPDGVGRFNHFQNGSIYYSPSTGAQMVLGAIYAKWAALGWERSALGYPTTDELTPPDKVGRLSHFQNGAIYWSPLTGAHEVRGAIYNDWASLGWERSGLGYPLTDETGTPDGIGRYNHFQGGSIYYTPSTGAHAVQGAIHAKWASLGWEKSAVGYPTTDELLTPDGIGHLNHFQGGAIYWTPTTGAHNVQGAIYAGWAAMGWERSTFGYPVSDEYRVPVGARSDFQGGAIVWVQANGGLQFCNMTPGVDPCTPEQGG